MYEMYPHTWSDGHVGHGRQSTNGQPRRRARRAHHVLPAVLRERIQPEGGEHGDDERGS